MEPHPISHPLMIDSVLVACPTYKGLEDLLDQYLTSYNAFSWQNRELLLVDNTKDNGVYTETLRQKGLNVIHIEPTDSFQDTFALCWQEIARYASERNVRWVFSLEQDVICPPLTLDTLLNVAGYVQTPFVTHTYPYHFGAKGLYQGLGCTLILRELLDKAMTELRENKLLVEEAIYKLAVRQSHVSLTGLLDIKHLDGQKGYWQFKEDKDPRIFNPPEYDELLKQGAIKATN